MIVYLDNAATTPLDPDVFEAMKPFFLEQFGNPSSIHAHGRVAKAAIEKSRKQIAACLGVAPAEIFFTSGGTEANNHALQRSIEAYKIKHAVTSHLEHHAVLHTLEYLQQKQQVQLHYVKHDGEGRLDLDSLEDTLIKYSPALVSIMHGNNEIGNLNPVGQIAEICQRHNALLHCDMVQTVGHFPLNLKDLQVDFATASAHKFHGPKGIGVIYINSDLKIPPLNHGGAQERNMRGGTENVAAIVGVSKALQIAKENQQSHTEHIRSLKQHMMDRFMQEVHDVKFNGLSAYMDQSLYTVLNVSLPSTDDNDMLLFNLDIHKISASAGSACSSGTNLASHVLSSIGTDPTRGAIRFSFSRFNTFREIDYVVSKIADIYKIRMT